MATFGYSVGDALTAIEIITRIIQTLRDTKESRSEYQHLLSDLNNLKLVFEELECFKSTADSAIERSNKNAIRGLASEYGGEGTYRNCLTEFRSLISPSAHALSLVSSEVPSERFSGPFS